MPRPAEHGLVTQAQRIRISQVQKAGVFERLREIHFLPLEPSGSSQDIPLVACCAQPCLFGFTLAIAHHVRPLFEDKRAVAYRVYIEVTSPRLGGERLWFTCPNSRCPRALSEPGTDLGEEGVRPTHWRMTTLYLPPGASVFCCRDCHGLTYRTQQLRYPRYPRWRDESRGILGPAPSPRQSEWARVAIAEERFLQQLEGAVRDGLVEEDPMPAEQPDLTLRQTAVWYLWGLARMRVVDLARLLKVSTRTIKRDLAAVRASGRQRPRAGATSVTQALDLVQIARVLLNASRRKAYQEMEALPEGSPGRLKLSESLLRLTGKEVELALAAEQLVTAAQGLRGQMTDGEWELMEAELSAKLAALVPL